MKKLRVFVVDDDPTTLKVAEAVLEKLGHEVIVRDQPIGTMAEIRRERPDVVLLDVNMPALSGDRLAELVRTKPEFASVRIILYSGLERAELVRLAGELGAFGAISKTGGQRELRAEFERLAKSL